MEGARKRDRKRHEAAVSNKRPEAVDSLCCELCFLMMLMGLKQKFVLANNPKFSQVIMPRLQFLNFAIDFST